MMAGSLGSGGQVSRWWAGPGSGGRSRRRWALTVGGPATVGGSGDSGRSSGGRSEDTVQIQGSRKKLPTCTRFLPLDALPSVDFVKWSSQGMLRMSPDAMNALFRPTIDSIIEHLRDLFQKPEVSTVKFLFLVGGFAEAPLLQQAVQAAFGDKCRIIIPQDVGLTILKGAVLFGLDPAVIKVRRSPLTYGVGVLNRYVEGKHPPEKLLVKDGTRWCTDVFDKFISADQSVALGELVKRSYTPAKPSQLVIIINIYSAEHDDVCFITDPGVKKCGTLRLDLTGTGGTAVPARREIQTLMQFGDTEIKATAVDIATSKSVKVGIDFLNY